MKTDKNTSIKQELWVFWALSSVFLRIDVVLEWVLKIIHSVLCYIFFLLCGKYLYILRRVIFTLYAIVYAQAHISKKHTVYYYKYPLLETSCSRLHLLKSNSITCYVEYFHRYSISIPFLFPVQQPWTPLYSGCKMYSWCLHIFRCSVIGRLSELTSMWKVKYIKPIYLITVCGETYPEKCVRLSLTCRCL